MPKKKKCIVAFDTSNYTTSIAVCDLEGRVLANLKAPLPVKDGERGLRQSDAVFAHTKNLPTLCDNLAEAIEELEPVAVGVSSTPRCADGSYMPCFLCGVAAAHSFAAQNKLKVYETSHQNGHIMAAAYSSGAFDKLMSSRFLAFHVSGGTTEALLITPQDNGVGFDVELVGETADINAGQAIDRVGVMLGIPFPCGKELELLASQYKGSIAKRQVCVRDGICSLSGVENIAQKMCGEGADKAEIAAFVFDFICRTLVKMTQQILTKYGDMPVLYAGGVMSNMLMREELSKHSEAYFSMPEFSSDNAAGVALITQRKLAAEETI